ncbi:TPA: DNA-protecting protein DprA [Candidatus Dependentiae bacterium]|nr:MAG: protecting protein DprA protein [candidate division TM6 bacterium GW2011_GWF2_36_131]KKQ02597.1 MAG: protecting protein DprA protein [candidate division TM6 bacterium GW2011_GWE2_36_25]KKQ19092.1 MAG: protecting protein DprA protein [candidate division TM6 bacterium GW2011_GWA2_36_9]HBR70182.1 DNA-protecting protein DprA [Candidatus Dependentiae bacterium]HCU00086.1 DNA-protecting protein DprA [Candidatus Dependentiae bacterium]
MNEQQVLILHLSLIPSVGPVTTQRLLNFCHEKSGTLTDVYQWSVKDFCTNGFSEKISITLFNGLKDRRALENERRLIEQYNIRYVTIIDDDYPPLLKHIYMPPVILYYCGGTLINYKKNIAIVGARKGNHYAQTVIDSLVPGLINNGWSVVSGGAFGVDAMAHQCALKNEGRTIAVLGSGLLRPYPFQHKKLFEQIAEKGSVVSPFPLTMEPQKGNFPARNRIIAGLSRGVVVAQAAEKSGALITAHFGLDQGKEIFAVPGNINDTLSSGCNRLIKGGACLVSDVNDILSAFGEDFEGKVHQTTIFKHVDPVKQAILDCCKKAVSIDDIVDQADITADLAYEHLFSLQIEGLIEQNFLGLFQVKQSISF